MDKALIRKKPPIKEPIIIAVINNGDVPLVAGWRRTGGGPDVVFVSRKEYEVERIC